MLRVVGAGRRFAGGTAALADVSLRVGAGEFVAVLGPSGCGKSTLLRLLAGLDQPDTGRIEWDGPPVQTGVVFQDPTLLPWDTALDNVRLPFRLRGAAGHAEAAAALARVGLAGFETARPRQLSGGMRMRVSLARALVTAPRLLLLDEPFAALDEFTRHRLQEDLRALWQADGSSVVLVTHSIYEAAFLAQRIVVMSARPGRVVAEIVSSLDGEGEARRLSPGYAAVVAQITGALRQVHAG